MSTRRTNRHVDSNNRHTFLLHSTVAPPTKRRYLKMVSHFYSWLIRHGYYINSGRSVDKRLCQFIHRLYRKGYGKSDADSVYYGVRMTLPQYRLSLPRSHAAINGFHRLTPGVRRPPIAWSVALVIAKWMVSNGYFRYGVAMIVGFDCFLRIGEIRGIHKSDVAFQGDLRMGDDIPDVFIHLRHTKTGDHQGVPVLNEHAIILLRAVVTLTKHDDDLLFPFSSSSFNSLVKRASAALGITVPFTSHSLRHGGATRYRLLGWRIDDLMERGRWSSSKSVRRYIQQSRQLLMLQSIPDSIHTQGRMISGNIVGSFMDALRGST